MSISPFLQNNKTGIAKVIKVMNEFGRRREPFFFMMDFLLNRPVVLPLKELNANFVRVAMGSLETGNKTPHPGDNGMEVMFEKFPMPFKEYKPIFEKAQKEIFYGNSYLLNLTQPTPVETNLTLQTIYEYSAAPFKLMWDNDFLVFSPERFVRMEGSRISSFPMKGTIDAGIKDAERSILNDAKEKAEHYTIVDLIRNDLSMVSKKVRVERFRYIDKVETFRGSLLQVSSAISGELDKDWHRRVGSIFLTLLPAGSVTGAPKKKTVEIIQEVENYDRGYYTGVFGIFDGYTLDSAVMIRYMEKNGSHYIFKSGGGITALSNAETEYKELIDKVYVPVIRNDKAGKREIKASPMAPTEG